MKRATGGQHRHNQAALQGNQTDTNQELKIINKKRSLNCTFYRRKCSKKEEMTEDADTIGKCLSCTLSFDIPSLPSSVFLARLLEGEEMRG